jgi:hypothetical protein
MDAKYYGLIEMVMMFAIVGGFTAWTFWSLREKPAEPPARPNRRKQQDADGDGGPLQSAEADGGDGDD